LHAYVEVNTTNSGPNYATSRDFTTYAAVESIAV